MPNIENGIVYLGWSVYLTSQQYTQMIKYPDGMAKLATSVREETELAEKSHALQYF